MGIKPVGKAWGRSHVDKKSFIIWSLSLAELSSDLAGRSHSEASVVFQGLSLLRAGPGFPAMRAASQRQGPPCCQPDGAEGVSLSCTSGCIPDTSLPRDDGWLACCFCHLVSLMACLGSLWLCVWRACPQFFFFSPSGQAQLHFLWPYQTLCFQNCYSATWGVEPTPPSLRPPS